MSIPKYRDLKTQVFAELYGIDYANNFINGAYITDEDDVANNTVMTEEMIMVDEKIAKELRQKAEDALLAKKREAVDILGDDEFPEATVIRFKKTWDGKQYYTYVALKANAKWYTTGRMGSKGAKEWYELVAWMVSGTPVDGFDVLVSKAEADERTGPTYEQGYQDGYASAEEKFAPKKAHTELPKTDVAKIFAKGRTELPEED